MLVRISPGKCRSCVRWSRSRGAEQLHRVTAAAPAATRRLVRAAPAIHWRGPGRWPAAPRRPRRRRRRDGSSPRSRCGRRRVAEHPQLPQRSVARRAACSRSSRPPRRSRAARRGRGPRRAGHDGRDRDRDRPPTPDGASRTAPPSRGRVKGGSRWRRSRIGVLRPLEAVRGALDGIDDDDLDGVHVERRDSPCKERRIDSAARRSMISSRSRWRCRRALDAKGSSPRRRLSTGHGRFAASSDSVACIVLVISSKQAPTTTGSSAASGPRCDQDIGGKTSTVIFAGSGIAGTPTTDRPHGICRASGSEGVRMPGMPTSRPSHSPRVRITIESCPPWLTTGTTGTPARSATSMNPLRPPKSIRLRSVHGRNTSWSPPG